MTTLHFFNKKRHETLCVNVGSVSHLFLHHGNRQFLDTPHEYWITLLALTAFPRPEFSFVEVYSDDTFICRHFIRDGKLQPFTSTTYDQRKCPLIRQPLTHTFKIATTPTRAPRKFKRDATLIELSEIFNELQTMRG